MSPEHISCSGRRSTALSLLASVVLLSTACGGGSSPAPVAPPTEIALAASGSGELLEHVKSLLRTRESQRQLTPGAALDALPAPGASLAVTATGSAVTYSNTTVQEQGIDEEDLLKTDGTSIYALDTTSRTASGSPRSLRAISGRTRMESDSSWVIALDTSAFDPLRSTMALSGDPAVWRA